MALAGDTSQDEITRILALWSLEGIRHYDKSLVTALLRSDQDNLRREAVRSLASFTWKAEDLVSVLLKLSKDENAMVRSQVLRTLEEVNNCHCPNYWSFSRCL